MASPTDRHDLPANRTITLADGRTLGFVEVGDPEGHPVVSNHGGLSSRLDVVPCDAAARAHGLRVISPDRPGIGLSDPRPGRTLAGWADDVGQLADQLGIDRFATMGWSFGGGFAQGVARHLADRLSALVLVASVVPVDWEGMRATIDRMDRVFMGLSEHALGRLAERSIFHVMAVEAHRRPEAFARQSGDRGPSAEALSAAIAEGLSDTDGVVEDYRTFDRPWGFDPAEITVPTQIWQGDADELVPPDWGHRLQAAIAGSTLTVVPGATHFLWYDHWDEIFDGLASAP
jgi:pimeloyl-ACP methyl ester carboxylesterase